MDDRLNAMVAAIRDELVRQASQGVAAYHGVGKDGRDGLDGYFDLVKVARAALAAMEARRAGPLHAPSGADVRALHWDADERQTQRQAPDDASPGESNQGASIG